MTESQDEAVADILADKVKAGDVVVVRYGATKRRPRHPRKYCIPPASTSSPRAGQGVCYDRWPLPRWHVGPVRGHVSPEAAAGGAIGLVRNGDKIRSDIPNRRIDVLLSRCGTGRPPRIGMPKGWKPVLPTSTQGVHGAEGLQLCWPRLPTRRCT